MTDQLFIDDKEVDLYPGTTISLNYQINDLAELKDRQANFSQQFKVPKTQKNISILGWANLVQSTTEKPYRKLPAVIVKNGVQVLPNGFAIIEGTDKDFNITVTSAIVDLMDKLKERKLSDLDLSAWDHVMDVATMDASKLNTEGYIYCVVDYNNDPLFCDDGAYTMKVSRNPPMMFVHTIIEKIFEEAEVSFQGDVFTRDKYKRMLLQLATDGFNHSDQWVEDNKVKAYSTFDTTIVWADVLRFLPFDDDSVQGHDPGGNWNSTFRYEKTSVKVKFKLHLDVTINSGTFAIEIRFGPATVVHTFPTVTASGVYEWESPELQRDSLSNFAGFWVNQPTGTDSATFNTGSWIDVEYIKTNVYGTDIQIAGVMPDISQKEFIKAILAHLYAGMPSIDPFTGVYKVVTFQEVVDKIPYANLWNEKLHMDRDTWKHGYRIGKYAQRNWLKYTEDENVTKGLGDGYFDIDDEVLEKETTLFTLPFAATDSVFRFGNGKKIPLIQLWDSDGENITTKPRILLLDIDETPAGPPFLNYIDDAGNFTPVTADVPYCHFIDESMEDNLGFDDDVIENEYPGLIATLQRLKVFESPFFIRSSEMNNLDHYTPVYVPELSSYFYINKVKGFTGKGLTKVELIRLGGGDVCIPTFSTSLFEDPEFLQGDTYWAAFSSPANWDIDNTGALHIPPGSSDRIENTTPVTSYAVSPTGKCKAVIRVSGMTTGSYYVELAGHAGVTRTTNGEYSEIITTGGDTLDRLIPFVSDDFDGKIEYADAFAQLTCP